MEKRAQMRQWFSLLDLKQREEVTIELSRKYNLVYSTVRTMWFSAGKISDNVVDDVITTLRLYNDKQDAERIQKKQSLIDAI